jgi:dTDP-glucose 4,6-dehydratase
MPVWPANDYAISKWANEMQIRNAIKERQQRIMTLRFFLVYGPGEEYSEYRSVVSIFCYRLLSGLPINVHQHCHRAFLYIDDFINTLAGAPMNFNAGEVINIANPDVRSVEDLAEIVLEATGASRDLLILTEKDKMNVQHKRPDIKLAQTLLGHQCLVSLEEGVLRTLDWMREKYDLPAFEVEYIPPEKNGAFQPLAPNPEVRFKDARVQGAGGREDPHLQPERAPAAASAGDLGGRHLAARRDAEEWEPVQGPRHRGRLGRNAGDAPQDAGEAGRHGGRASGLRRPRPA